MIVIRLILTILALTVTEPTFANLYRTVSGEVVLGKTCGKRPVSDFRLVIRQESAIDNNRYQQVPLTENGKYTVLLSESYHYDFRVIEAGDTNRVMLGGARFDYHESGQVPAITAVCKGEGEKS